MVDMEKIRARISGHYADAARHNPGYVVTAVPGDASNSAFDDPLEILEFDQDQVVELCGLLASTSGRFVARDHKLLWAWAVDVARECNHWHDRALFDQAWLSRFEAFSNLMLAVSRAPIQPQLPREPMPDSAAMFEAMGRRAEHARQWRAAMLSDRREFGNRHVFDLHPWELAPPMAFALLEGTLRRKNRAHFSVTGEVIASLDLATPKGVVSFRTHNGRKVKTRSNSVAEQLWALQQATWKNKAIPLAALQHFENSVPSASPAERGFTVLYGWRNAFLHGEDFWQIRTPLLASLLALLIIEELPSNLYADFVKRRRWLGSLRERDAVYPMDFYPPELDEPPLNGERLCSVHGRG